MTKSSVLAVLIFVMTQATLAATAPAPVVFTRDIKLADLFTEMIYPARLLPVINAAILADAEGVISSIDAPLGKTVRRGQKILVIKNTDPIYHYAPMMVTSPVGGVVSQVLVTEGSRVSKGEKLVLVTDPQHMRVTIEVSAHDRGNIKSGMKADLRVPSFDKPLKVIVRGISPFVDPGTGTSTCELDLAPKQKLDGLAPGLLGQVGFKVSEHKGISLPEGAITYRGKDPFVRIVREGKAFLQPVALGEKQFGEVEILKGIKAGDRVVERANGFISDGEAVQVEATEGKTDKI